MLGRTKKESGTSNGSTKYPICSQASSEGSVLRRLLSRRINQRIFEKILKLNINFPNCCIVSIKLYEFHVQQSSSHPVNSRKLLAKISCHGFHKIPTD